MPKKKKTTKDDEYINISFDIPFKLTFLAIIPCICILAFCCVIGHWKWIDYQNRPEKFIYTLNYTKAVFVNLSGGKYEDIAILETPFKTPSTVPFYDEMKLYTQNLKIYSYDFSKHKWIEKIHFYFEVENTSGKEMEVHSGLIPDRDVIVLTEYNGSGAFLSYSVIGDYRIIGTNENYEDSDIYSSDCNLYHGSYEIKDGEFIGYSSGKWAGTEVSCRFKYSGEKLVLVK